MSDAQERPEARGERRQRPSEANTGRQRRLPGRPGRPAAPRPRAVTGGVQSGIGENWWTARWLAALERLGWSVRLQRSAPSARPSNVLRVDVQPGQITAAVKGSQPKPYRVTIRIEPLTDLEWDRVMDALAAQALFAARLLAGEMPTTIEDAFAQAGVTLFPTSAKDFYASCSCPNWSNPCKHVAAVHYTLGAEFDRDPFLLFWLRGRSRQQIIEALRARRTTTSAAPVEGSEVEEAPAEPPQPSVPPLSECLDNFWQAGPSLIGEQPSVTRPEVPESVLRRLGLPPFWRGDYDVLPILVDAYRTISREAIALAHPEQPVERPTLPTPLDRAGPAPATGQPPDRFNNRRGERPSRQPRSSGGPNGQTGGAPPASPGAEAGSSIGPADDADASQPDGQANGRTNQSRRTGRHRWSYRPRRPGGSNGAPPPG